MAVPNRKKIFGVALGLTAIIAATAGWARFQASGEASTDNAYVRGDVTSLAPKVGGYVTDVEVDDNQPVRAGDVLFRIDDRDYRARLANAEANVSAAQARLVNVDAEIQLQHALIRQAEAQRRATVAELELAISLGIQGLSTTPLECVGLSGYVPRLLFWVGLPRASRSSSPCSLPATVSGGK